MWFKMHSMESAGRTRILLDKASADSKDGLSRTATFKERTGDDKPRLHRGSSAPDLRQMSRFQQDFQQGTTHEDSHLQPVHEGSTKAGKHLEAFQTEDGAQGPAVRAKVKKNLAKVANFFRKSGREPESDEEGGEEGLDDSGRGPQRNADAERRPTPAVRRLSRFSDGAALDDSLHGSRQSGAMSQEGGSLRKEDNEASEPSNGRSSRRRLAKTNAIVQRSAHAMRRYTTHSVSRRSLTKGNMEGQVRIHEKSS